MTWLNGPFGGVDTETTGVDTNTDRLVTACVGLVRHPGDWSPRSWMANPGIEIPEAAAAVHGVPTEYAREHGAEPGEVIQSVVNALYTIWGQGAPVIAYNAVFDLTLLDRESRRHLGEPLELAGPVIDPLVIDKHLDQFRRGSRKLVDVAALHGIELTNAHNADDDCFTAVRLAWTMVTHSHLADLSAEALHDAQIGWYHEQRSSFHDYLRKQGKRVDDPNTVWPMAPHNEREKAA